MIDDCRACGGPASNDVDDACRDACALAYLREKDRRQGRKLGRLKDDSATGSERWCNLPGEHQQREVPWDDLARNADGCLTGKFVRERLGPACVVDEVTDRERYVDVAAFADRLAVVEGFQHCKEARMALHRAADRVEDPCARIA